MSTEERDDDADDTGDDTDTGFLDPPAPANGLGATPQQSEPATQQPAAASPRRGGRPKGSRNRTPQEREAAAATGVGAPTSRPAGAAGKFPGEEGKIPNDADLMWMYVLEEIQAAGYSPYDMEIRVDRKTPLPAVPMATFDASSVMGDQSTSPATALRNYITDWIHLPSGVLGPGLYTVHFCWRNKAQFFRRGELQVGSRNEILAMKQAEQARQAQSGAAGFGAGFGAPQFAPPPHAPHAQQQQQQQQVPAQQQPQPYYYPGFGVLPQQQPAQQPFDADAERAKIRHELEREMEITRMRQELDDLRRRPPAPQYPPPSYAPHFPPPQPQRRGAGAPSPQPQYYETEDERIARVVVSVLHQTGVVPRGQQPTAAGVGATPPTPGQTQAFDFVDNMERGLEMAARTKKVIAAAAGVFGGETPKPKGAGAAAAAEEDKPTPKLRFQPTGQKYKGHDTMVPVDENDEPIIPTTLPMILATGIANPFLLEPIAQGVGAVLSQGAGLLKGFGGLGQQQPGPQRSDIQVQQMPPQQAQVLQQAQQLQQPTAAPQAPAPTPYYPPQQTAPQPAPDGGGWTT